MVSVQFITIPDGADIYIDNTYTFHITPATVDIPAGSHSYLLSLDNYLNISGTINVADGYYYVVNADLQSNTEIQNAETFKQANQIAELALVTTVLGGILAYFIYKKSQEGK